MKGTLPKRIFICGFMGAGKSTVGENLAAELEQSFYDLDFIIEEKAGRSITEIFETQGEAGFRQKERAALLSVIRNKKGVIALGGGTLQNQHILDHVKVNGLLVFIETPLPTILDRIMGNEQRPLLLNEQGRMKSRAELKAELETLFSQRLPFYHQAEVTINTADYTSTNDLITELVKKIKYHVALH